MREPVEIKMEFAALIEELGETHGLPLIANRLRELFLEHGDSSFESGVSYEVSGLRAFAEDHTEGHEAEYAWTYDEEQ